MCMKNLIIIRFSYKSDIAVNPITTVIPTGTNFLSKINTL